MTPAKTSVDSAVCLTVKHLKEYPAFVLYIEQHIRRLLAQEHGARRFEIHIEKRAPLDLMGAYLARISASLDNSASVDHHTIVSRSTGRNAAQVVDEAFESISSCLLQTAGDCQPSPKTAWGESDCASCGAVTDLSWSLGVAFCGQCIQRSRVIDPLYDDLGTGWS